MEILGKLFSSNAIVKIMRLFLFNPESCFENKDICEKSKVSSQALKTETSILNGIGFIKKKVFYKEQKSIKKGGKVAKKKINGWCLDKNFPHIDALATLLTSRDLIKKEEVLKRFKNTGKIKLIIVSGIFLQDDDSRMDLLIVGDGLKKRSLDNALHFVEAEVGKELTYSAMETEEFKYRLGMYDKFIRDILDGRHQIIFDRLNLGKGD